MSHHYVPYAAVKLGEEICRPLKQFIFTKQGRDLICNLQQPARGKNLEFLKEVKNTLYLVSRVEGVVPSIMTIVPFFSFMGSR